VCDMYRSGGGGGETCRSSSMSREISVLRISTHLYIFEGENIHIVYTFSNVCINVYILDLSDNRNVHHYV